MEAKLAQKLIDGCDTLFWKDEAALGIKPEEKEQVAKIFQAWAGSHTSKRIGGQQWYFLPWTRQKRQPNAIYMFPAPKTMLFRRGTTATLQYLSLTILATKLPPGTWVSPRTFTPLLDNYRHLKTPANSIGGYRDWFTANNKCGNCLFTADFFRAKRHQGPVVFLHISSRLIRYFPNGDDVHMNVTKEICAESQPQNAILPNENCPPFTFEVRTQRYRTQEQRVWHSLQELVEGGVPCELINRFIVFGSKPTVNIMFHGEPYRLGEMRCHLNQIQFECIKSVRIITVESSRLVPLHELLERSDSRNALCEASKHYHSSQAHRGQKRPRSSASSPSSSSPPLKRPRTTAAARPVTTTASTIAAAPIQPTTTAASIQPTTTAAPIQPTAANN